MGATRKKTEHKPRESHKIGGQIYRDNLIEMRGFHYIIDNLRAFTDVYSKHVTQGKSDE